MDIINARKVIISLDNYFHKRSNLSTLEYESLVSSLGDIIKSNSINVIYDVFENNNHLNFEILKLICSFFSSSKLLEIVSSNKFKNVLGNDGIKIVWNHIDIDSRIDYFNSCKFISERDYYLLEDMINTGDIDVLDIKDKVNRNSLNIEISKENFDSYKFLSNKNIITEFYSKLGNKLDEFKNFYSSDMLNSILDYSLKIEDSSKLSEYLLKNDDLLIKLEAQTIANVFSTDEISNLISVTPLPNLINAMYYKNLSLYGKLINKYFNSIPNNSLNYYAFNELNRDLFSNSNNFFKFKNICLDKVILSNYSDEFIIDLFRNVEFINNIDSCSLTKLLNGLPFSTIFNLLQRVDVYNKVNLLDFNILSNEKSLVIGFLESNYLCKKIKPCMYSKFLLKLDYEDVLKYLSDPFIVSSLTGDEFINLLIIKNINIKNFMGNDVYSSLINKDLLVSYINKMWEVNFDLDLINDVNVLKVIFDIDDVNTSDIDYLFTTIRNKEQLSVNSSRLSVLSYKSILVAYKLFGIQDTLKILFNSKSLISIDDIRKYRDLYIDSKVLYNLNNAGTDINKLYDNIVYELRDCSINNSLNIKEFCFYRTLCNLGVSDKDIIRTIKRYLDYSEIDIDVASNELDSFCTYYKDKYVDGIRTKFNKEFIKNCGNLLTLKSSISSNITKKANSNVLFSIKCKLLYMYLVDHTDISYFVKGNIKLSTKVIQLEKYIDKYMDFDLFKELLLLISNDNFSIKDYLSSNGILEPDNYDEYVKIINSNEVINKLNRYFMKLSYSLTPSKLNLVAKSVMSNNVKDRKHKKIISYVHSKLNLEVDSITYDVRSNTFMNSNIMNSYLNSESVEYYNTYMDLERLIMYVDEFFRGVFINKMIYSSYSDKFANIKAIDYYDRFDLNDFVVDDTLYNINDLESVVSGLSIHDCSLINKGYIDILYSKLVIPLMFSNITLCSPSLLLSKYDEFMKYIKDNDIDMESLSTNKIVTIFSNLSNSLVGSIFGNINKSYLEVVNDDMVLSAYKDYLSTDSYALSNYSNGEFCLVNGISLIKRIIDDNKSLEFVGKWNISFYLYHDKLIKLEVSGNCLVVSVDFAVNKVDIDTINKFVNNIIDGNDYLDYVLTSNFSLLKVNKGKINELYILSSKDEYCDVYNTYHGELVKVNRKSIKYTKNVSKSLLNIMKLNYLIKNDIKLDDNDEFNKYIGNFEYIEFDGFDVLK